MKYKHLVIAFCLCFCWLSYLYGQVHENTIPLSVKENLPAVTYFVDMPAFDSSFLKNKTGSEQKLLKQLQFAHPFYIDLDPDNSGEWTETNSGRVWRLGIRSVNAFSLYLTLQYFLSPGVKMFVYGPGYNDFHGAFTSRNNNSAEILSIAPVQGDKIIIELNVPDYRQFFGKIKVTRVYHDYYGIYNDQDVHGLKSLKICDEDINCSNGRYWQTEKRSVCRIISNGGMGTGTLIGNTSGNSTPYVLFAYHVISSAEVAAEAIFLFNHETTGCHEDLQNTVQSLSGATLLATTDHHVDFTLMRLSEKPPPSYMPYYAGWDARDIISRKGVCIHHPYGIPKQIAIEYHPIISEDIGEGFDQNSTWKVSHWELGTTESGSSGAPLFNEQHRIIGTLTGGRATCGYPYDDYFTKFSVSWETFPDSSNQLKCWLDSSQTGQLVLNGYDPYGFNTEYCDTAWNFTVDDKLGLSNDGLIWGWISGHNSEGYTQFAERFESQGVIQLNGIYLNVARAYSSNPLSYIELKVWEGTQFPEKELYTEMLFIRDMQPDKVNYVVFDSVLMRTGTFFVGYKINYNSVSDTFAVYHALDRGYTKSSSMYIYNNNQWYQSKDPVTYGMNISLGLGISECYGKSSTPSNNVLNVYPNPCTNSVTIDIPGGMPVYEIKCYDINGCIMPVILRQNEDGNMLYFSLRSGIYFVKIITAEKSFVTRLIVLKNNK